MTRAETAKKQTFQNEIAAEIKALIEILGEPDSDLFPPLIDALEVTAGFETALATALGEELTAPIDEAAERHWASLGPLPGKTMLPANTRPLSDFVKGPLHLSEDFPALASFQMIPMEPSCGSNLNLANGLFRKMASFGGGMDLPLRQECLMLQLLGLVNATD